MTRRKKLIAAAIAVPIALAVGLGVKMRRAASDIPGSDICDDDLGEVFEMCQPSSGFFYCEGTPEGYEDACQAGCVMTMCPAHVSCTGQNPIGCAPCEDMHGARFWYTLNRAQMRCENKLHFGHVKISEDEFNACFEPEVEQICPALAGTEWREQMHALP